MQISNNDPLGLALKEFLSGEKRGFIEVTSSLGEHDQLWVKQFFRAEKEMPKIETLALDLCRGKTLDVGAGAGAHSLYLAKKDFEIFPIDISAGAVEVMQKQGLKNARQINFFDLQDEKYDTILMLMNGIGIVGKIKRLDAFFQHCDKLLDKGGQLVFDSSDIIYMFEDDYGQFELDHKKYYGEVRYRMSYKNVRGPQFDWLFIDFAQLESIAAKNGFRAELIYKEKNFAYVCRCFRIE